MKRWLGIAAAVLALGAVGACDDNDATPAFEVTGPATLVSEEVPGGGGRQWVAELTAHNNTGSGIVVYWSSDEYEGLDTGYRRTDEGPFAVPLALGPHSSVPFEHRYAAAPGAFGEATVASTFYARVVDTEATLTAEYLVTLTAPAP